ncbi:MAG: SpoIIE family protein phosphatase, partial [Calditrichaceae bacterium]|nr:SpoIIE family protein phosphatase [Calditrichaceae bacterium]
GVLVLITLLYDVLKFYSSVSFTTWNYINETINILIVILYYLYLRTRLFYNESNVQKNLKNFIKLLALLYVIVFSFKLILNPTFTAAIFPQQPESMIAVIYSNIATLAAILLFTPIIITLKNLIKYKRKKRTGLYFTITLIFAFVTVILTVVFVAPLDLSFKENALYNNITFSVTMIFLFIIATRNSWITYLSRREKIYFSIIGVILVWLILKLFDITFKEPVTAHSLALGALANIGWIFLSIYSVMATLFLLLQLPTARAFDRKMREVNSLYDLSRTISVEYDHDKLVHMVTDMSTEVIESTFTWLELYDDMIQSFKIGAYKNLDDDEIMILRNMKRSIINNLILSTKKTYIINDISKSDFANLFDELDKKVGSFAGVPLLSTKGDIIGILYSAKSAILGFDPDDVNLLEAYASQAAIALENAQLLKISLERERMEKELQIAREVQRRLLPHDTPKMKNLQVDTLTITAYEVGGDYYDFFHSNNENLGLVIGDVSGKGTSAAFYMAETKGIIQSLATHYISPKDILIHTNKLLYSSMEKKSFISLLAANIDLHKKSLTFARAGHCPIIYFDAKTKQTSMFKTKGIAVGLDSGQIFDSTLEEYKIKVNKNDIIAFYTDGLSEARAANGEEFGEERLCGLIKENSGLDVSLLKDVIIDNILGFLDGQNLHDDLTLVLIKL